MSETIVIAILVFLIAYLFVLFEFRRTHDYSNPMVLFLGFWGLIVLFAGFSLFGMIKVSSSTYIYIGIGLIFFAISWYVYELMPRITIKQMKKIRFDTMQRLLLYGIACACIVFYIYYSWITLKRLLSGYSYVDIRNIHQGYVEEKAFDNGALSLMGFVFFAPISQSIFCISAVNYFKNMKNLSLFVLTTICMFLCSFATASRFSLIFVMLIFIVLLIRYRDNLKINVRRRIKRIVLIIGIIVIVLVWIRSLGKNSTVLYTIFETLYHYLASPVPLLDLKIKSFETHKAYTYGKMFFYGFLDLFDSILKYAGIADVDFVSDARYYIIDNERFVRIYKEHNFNAFVSLFYYFYIDFGVVGIAIGSSLWARLLHRIYDKFRKCEDIGAIAVYCEFIYFIFLSGVRWPFSHLHNILLVLFTLWLTAGNFHTSKD